MAGSRAPKQWCLTKTETITSFESWRHNLQYTLSLDRNFAMFLVDGATWTKKSPANPTRGLMNDDDDLPDERRRTAAQKVAHLELMLGQIANYCPVLSRNTIVKNSTSIQSVWQAIRMHFGFQSTGAHFLDFDSIHLEADERPEDLFQRLTSFVEDSLLKRDEGISHHGDLPDVDEELSPTLENLITLIWLRLLHKDLPSLVKQRYGPDLRARTLASLKPEISQALDSLLDEIRSNNDARVLRTAFKTKRTPMSIPDTKEDDPRSKKSCPLCKQAGRPRYDHYLSMCRFLPPEDKHFMSRARQTITVDEPAAECQDVVPYPNLHWDEPTGNATLTYISRRVSVKQSPVMKAYYDNHVLCITLDSGAEVNMIHASTATLLGIDIQKTNQKVLQADGSTPLEIVGETCFDVIREDLTLHIEALVVKDLDVDCLAGIPFMSTNDVSIRPARQEIMVGDSHTIQYYTSQERVRGHIRRAHAFTSSSPPATRRPRSHSDIEEHRSMSQQICLEDEESYAEICHAHAIWPEAETQRAGRGRYLINDVSASKQPEKDEQPWQKSTTTSMDDGLDKTLPEVLPSSSPQNTLQSRPDENLLNTTYDDQSHAIASDDEPDREVSLKPPRDTQDVTHRGPSFLGPGPGQLGGRRPNTAVADLTRHQEHEPPRKQVYSVYLPLQLSVFKQLDVNNKDPL